MAYNMCMLCCDMANYTTSLNFKHT